MINEVFLSGEHLGNGRVVKEIKILEKAGLLSLENNSIFYIVKFQANTL